MKICKMCGKEITAERRKTYCSEVCYLKGKNEERKKPIVAEASGKEVLKKRGVCTGCKYNCKGKDRWGNCDYIGIEGHSRILVERANGGVKADSCICYKPRKERK